jgi:hypothetical protein
MGGRTWRRLIPAVAAEDRRLPSGREPGSPSEKLGKDGVGEFEAAIAQANAIAGAQ